MEQFLALINSLSIIIVAIALIIHIRSGIHTRLTKRDLEQSIKQQEWLEKNENYNALRNNLIEAFGNYKKPTKK